MKNICPHENKKKQQTQNLSEVFSVMPSAMVGEIIGFFTLLSKTVEEIGRGMKRSGAGDSARKRKCRFLRWRDGESLVSVLRSHCTEGQDLAPFPLWEKCMVCPFLWYL